MGLIRKSCFFPFLLTSCLIIYKFHYISFFFVVIRNKDCNSLSRKRPEICLPVFLCYSACLHIHLLVCLSVYFLLFTTTHFKFRDVDWRLDLNVKKESWCFYMQILIHETPMNLGNKTVPTKMISWKNLRDSKFIYLLKSPFCMYFQALVCREGRACWKPCVKSLASRSTIWDFSVTSSIWFSR